MLQITLIDLPDKSGLIWAGNHKGKVITRGKVEGLTLKDGWGKVMQAILDYEKESKDGGKESEKESEKG